MVEARTDLPTWRPTARGGRRAIFQRRAGAAQRMERVPRNCPTGGEARPLHSPALGRRVRPRRTRDSLRSAHRRHPLRVVAETRLGFDPRAGGGLISNCSNVPCWTKRINQRLTSADEWPYGVDHHRDDGRVVDGPGPPIIGPTALMGASPRIRARQPSAQARALRRRLAYDASAIGPCSASHQPMRSPLRRRSS